MGAPVSTRASVPRIAEWRCETLGLAAPATFDQFGGKGGHPFSLLAFSVITRIISVLSGYKLTYAFMITFEPSQQ